MTKLLWVVALLVFAAGCEDPPKGEVPARFAGVTRKPIEQEKAARFCDQLFPTDGDGVRLYAAPPLRPLEGAPAVKPGERWRWVNAWATWCAPCVEEMALLGRWGDALRADGVNVQFELLSIDAAENEPQLREALARKLPGAVQWIRSEEDFGPWLEGLGVDRAAAIPIHVLVDPQRRLRCVRVGAVHAQDYGAVRALLSSAVPP